MSDIAPSCACTPFGVEATAGPGAGVQKEYLLAECVLAQSAAARLATSVSFQTSLINGIAIWRNIVARLSEVVRLNSLGAANDLHCHALVSELFVNSNAFSIEACVGWR